MLEDTTMIQRWDKVFQKSDKVNHRKVTFTNRFGIALVADLYEPKRQAEEFPAIAVCGSSGQLKNNHQDFMLKQWQNGAF